MILREGPRALVSAHRIAPRLPCGSDARDVRLCGRKGRSGTAIRGCDTDVDHSPDWDDVELRRLWRILDDRTRDGNDDRRRATDKVATDRDESAWRTRSDRTGSPSVWRDVSTRSTYGPNG